eukprot:TRINITY_DN19739_c0_g1_i1.p1 TRINITY_DN19739_c0_g1~~TRINITY_DN19739_c0_g1_i1.p1  ORF type:complete len:431 (+),score=23.81 TRINITY_DN19739_c0_g1_i1:127-1419(+)
MAYGHPRFLCRQIGNTCSTYDDKYAALDAIFSQYLIGSWHTTGTNNGTVNDLFKFDNNAGKVAAYGSFDRYDIKFRCNIILYDGKYVNKHLVVEVTGDVDSMASCNKTHTRFIGESNATAKSFSGLFALSEAESDSVNTEYVWNKQYSNSSIKILMPEYNITLIMDVSLPPKETPVGVWVYASTLCLMLVVCMVYFTKEINTCSASLAYGKYISVYSLLLSTSWNAFTLIIHLIITTKVASVRYPLILPTLLLLYFTLYTHLKLYMFIWKSKNTRLFEGGHTFEELRVGIFAYHCKIYAAISILWIFVTVIIFSQVLLFLFFALLWVPQIIINVINATAKAPSFKFILIVSAMQLFVPTYINCFDDNIFDYKPNPMIGLAIISCLSAEVTNEIVHVGMAIVFAEKKRSPFLRATFLKTRDISLSQTPFGY